MKELCRAALGKAAKRLILIDPSPLLCTFIAERPETELMVVLCTRKRLATKCAQAIGEHDPPFVNTIVSVIFGKGTDLPFAPGCFDALCCCVGLPSGAPLVLLKAYKAFLRPGGAFLLVSRLREGPFGLTGSVAKRVVRKTALPKATDLTSWMLISGMRKIRQATVTKRLVPTVLTWAEVGRSSWRETRD